LRVACCILYSNKTKHKNKTQNTVLKHNPTLAQTQADTHPQCRATYATPTSHLHLHPSPHHHPPTQRMGGFVVAVFSFWYLLLLQLTVDVDMDIQMQAS
jgi:hypothetical protein